MSESFGSAEPLPQAPEVLSPIAVIERPPFWRRLFAFFLDGLILGVVGAIVGVFAEHWFSTLGVWGRLFGGAVGVAYFGICASAATGGQTIGKRITRIAVKQVNGASLSLPVALARATILMLPLACNGLALGGTTWLVPTLASIAVFVLGGSILYLFLFNPRTRRTMHDYATQSVVIRTDSPIPAILPAPAWRAHFAILASLIVVGCAIAYFSWQKVRAAVDFTALRHAQQDIAAVAHTQNVQVVYGSTWSAGSQQTWIRAQANTYIPAADSEGLANAIAAAIFRDIPSAGSRSIIAVTLSHGYDILFANSWNSRTWNYAPGEWQKRLATGSAAH